MNNYLNKFFAHSPSQFKFSNIDNCVKFIDPTSIKSDLPLFSYLEYLENWTILHHSDNSALAFSYIPSGHCTALYLKDINDTQALKIDHLVSFNPSSVNLDCTQSKGYSLEELKNVIKSNKDFDHNQYIIPPAYPIIHNPTITLSTWLDKFPPDQTDWSPLYNYLYEEISPNFFSNSDLCISESIPHLTPSRPTNVVYLPTLLFKGPIKFKLIYNPFLIPSHFNLSFDNIKELPEEIITFLQTISIKKLIAGEQPKNEGKNSHPSLSTEFYLSDKGFALFIEKICDNL